MLVAFFNCRKKCKYSYFGCRLQFSTVESLRVNHRKGKKTPPFEKGGISTLHFPGQIV